MRKFKYLEPGEVHVVTEKEIIDHYFPYWSCKMKSAGKEDLISEERCIEDFCIVHWAWEVG